MSLHEVAAALDRVASILRRKPELGPHDDMPAQVRWEGGTRVSVAHASGLRMETDMPRELGGGGDAPTPGWLMRASTASCAVTRVVMAAAAEGIALDAVEAAVGSRSDTRGLLGLADAGGAAISPAPIEVTLRIRVAAAGVPPERLRRLVEASCLHAPVQSALQEVVPVRVEVEVAEP